MRACRYLLTITIIHFEVCVQVYVQNAFFRSRFLLAIDLRAQVNIPYLRRNKKICNVHIIYVRANAYMSPLIGCFILEKVDQLSNLLFMFLLLYL